MIYGNNRVAMLDFVESHQRIIASRQASVCDDTQEGSTEPVCPPASASGPKLQPQPSLLDALQSLALEEDNGKQPLLRRAILTIRHLVRTPPWLQRFRHRYMRSRPVQLPFGQLKHGAGSRLVSVTRDLRPKSPSLATQVLPADCAKRDAAECILYLTPTLLHTLPDLDVQRDEGGTTRSLIPNAENRAGSRLCLASTVSGSAPHG